MFGFFGMFRGLCGIFEPTPIGLTPYTIYGEIV